MMTEKKKKSINLLDLIPEIKCRWEKNGDGGIFLLVPRFKWLWVRQIALKLGRTEFVKVRLDSIGVKVWELMDGQKTVEQIGKLIEEEHAGSFPQVYERLGLFLTTLSKNRLILLKPCQTGIS